MKNYLALMKEVLAKGELRDDRTGVGTTALFSKNLNFDLREGFPAVTTKKLAFKSVVAELIGFLKGYDNAADFRALGTKIWDANANAESWQSNPNCKGVDDLGSIYGVQWRSWQDIYPDCAPEYIDQLSDVIKRIQADPTDRRLVVTAYNPGELDQACLPPCHMFFQFYVSNDRHLDIQVYTRSVDVFLGMPFNIASYALLLELVARQTNLQARMLDMVFGDTHIYNNHHEVTREQLSREPRELPALWIDPKVTGIDDLESTEQVKLDYYDPYPTIKAEMAV